MFEGVDKFQCISNIAQGRGETKANQLFVSEFQFIQIMKITNYNYVIKIEKYLYLLFNLI